MKIFDLVVDYIEYEDSYSLQFSWWLSVVTIAAAAPIVEPLLAEADKFHMSSNPVSQLELSQALKGIVSRDWGGLQMILLDRLEVLFPRHIFLFVAVFVQ